MDIKRRIEKIIWIKEKQSLVQREGEPITDLVYTDELIKELNRMLRGPEKKITSEPFFFDWYEGKPNIKENLGENILIVLDNYSEFNVLKGFYKKDRKGYQYFNNEGIEVLEKDIQCKRHMILPTGRYFMWREQNVY